MTCLVNQRKRISLSNFNETWGKTNTYSNNGGRKAIDIQFKMGTLILMFVWITNFQLYLYEYGDSII